MRRKDREMDRDFALQVLDKCEYAVLATVNPDGTPYCVPITIVRDGDGIYFHSALAGQKVENLRQNPNFCLTAVGETHIPADKFTTEYEAAVVQGIATEITDATTKKEALRLLCQRHVASHMVAFEEEVTRSLERTAVWRIPLSNVTGKRKKYDKTGKEMKFRRMK